MNKLKKYANGTRKRIWSKEGNQGNAWLSASVELVLTTPASAIFIESNLIDWNYGDICIDNIRLNKGSCNGN